VSFIYLAESGEVSSAESYSDIPASVLSRLRNFPDKSCCKDNRTESFPDSLFGMMSEPLMENRGEDKLTSSVEDSPVKTSVPQEKRKALKVPKAVFGHSSHVL
jgi:hypothetical protein